MKSENLHNLNADSKFLISRLRRGEEAAYEMLFKEYYQVLTIFANKYLKDLEASKEVVQFGSVRFAVVYERESWVLCINVSDADR